MIKLVDLCWSVILTSIWEKAAFLSQRSFTIFQRAVLINIVSLSKVWYTAHTYPLTIKYAKLMTKEIFHFQWQSNYNPIKREVLYQSKDEGGDAAARLVESSTASVGSWVRIRSSLDRLQRRTTVWDVCNCGKSQLNGEPLCGTLL